MPDLRELFNNPEEAFRTMWAGIQKHLHTALVSNVTQASDGKTVVAQPAIKQTILDQTLTQTSYVDFPLLLDMPVHFPGGAGVTLTHGIAEGDEILSIFAGRPIDSWFQNGGTQQQIFDRMHSLSDGVAIPGVRSTPRELKQISTASAQLRSDDKHHVVDHHPANGTTVQSADPSTPPASDSFDPFTMATKFIRHAVLGASGLLGQAVNGGTTHDHGVDYVAGPFMRAANALHSVLCDPTNGPSLNAANLLHQVLASPTLGALLSGDHGASTVTAGMAGVALSSTSGISLSCPAEGLNLPSGGVASSALASGAAAANIGPLGGDLAGTLPNPTVVSIAHLVGMDSLPRAANDAAAAALNPPVPVGSAYLNTSVATGTALLAIRVA